MTWQLIADEINRRLVQFASPPVLTAEMVGLLNETYDELIGEWFALTFEKDEYAINVMAPLKRGPVAIAGVAQFDLGASFPGYKWMTSLRGSFKQACNQQFEWRNIEFLSDNDMSDIDNPLREPTADFPRYKLGWNAGTSLKQVTIFADSGSINPAAASIVAYYFIHHAVLTSITSSPEISLEGHYKIVKRACWKQAGINEDARTPVFEKETVKDSQVQII